MQPVASDLNDFSALTVPVRLDALTNDLAGNYTVKLEVALEDYPEVKPFSATFQVNIRPRIEVPLTKPYMEGFLLRHVGWVNSTWSYSLPRPHFGGSEGGEDEDLLPVEVKVNLFNTAPFVIFDENSLELTTDGPLDVT